MRRRACLRANNGVLLRYQRAACLHVDGRLLAACVSLLACKHRGWVCCPLPAQTPTTGCSLGSFGKYLCCLLACQQIALASGYARCIHLLLVHFVLQIAKSMKLFFCCCHAWHQMIHLDNLVRSAPGKWQCLVLSCKGTAVLSTVLSVFVPASLPSWEIRCVSQRRGFAARGSSLAAPAKAEAAICKPSHS